MVNSHICDKNLQLLKEKLVNQAKRIAKPRKGKKLLDEIGLFDEMVLGIQNYFQIATCVSLDCRDFNRAVMTILTNRLKTQKGSRLVRTDGAMTESEQNRFGKSKTVRYVSGIMRPIYPIAYIKCRVPILLHSSITHYSQEGRLKLHENLAINQFVLTQFREEKIFHRSLEFSDCRLSLFSAQKGKCAISGAEFMLGEDVLCWLVG